ncbi:MAG: 4-phosphoerythronate dehydrogenase PdxB [Massilibacteroides sp.]|nr:4-phosphoerythronate dehydrogenase PdxB [Massilibacteroides sp.]MDD3061991.1 4-phosphoerythronate dehydrogenase PdxB [Massilibacteroides sp.]MDD4114046.1 4-phosphoerythronate dehydrogenase PdxB [Massilibacteroides sp.]MDD4659292.1 4-phosphoerythronate dehydrogenase PdxB [Massilibacteroides sp.]
MKLIADYTIPFLKGIAEDFAEVLYLPSTDFSPAAVKDADALIVRSVDKCTRELLEGSRVKLIVTATIGFDHIDTAYCEEAGIVWKNVPGCNAVSVAEYVVSALLYTALKLDERLAGKTIGIIGVGHVGKEVERCCSALGMQVLRNDPPRAELEGESNFVSLDVIAREADVITLHTPLEKTGKYPTYHLADQTFFKKLKLRPWFLNAARGGILDTKALIEAKKEGLVSELILDCWEREPAIDRQLLDLATIATPHIAGFSADGKANATRACLENIATFFQIPSIRTAEVLPPPPSRAVIDLSKSTISPIAQAVFHCFNPELIDKRLRKAPEKFEDFRAHYDHPREFSAYTIVNASKKDTFVLKKLGFKTLT